MAELAEQDPWLSEWKSRVRNTVDSHFVDLTEQVDEIFSLADARFEGIEVYAPPLPRPSREEVDAKIEQTLYAQMKLFGLSRMQDLLGPLDSSDIEKALPRAVRNMNFSGMLSYEFEEIAEDEAACSGLRIEHLRAKGHPFKTEEDEPDVPGGANPYRALIAVASNPEFVTHQAIDAEGGTFLDWGVDRTTDTLEVFDWLAREANTADVDRAFPKAQIFDRLRAYLIKAATYAQQLETEQERDTTYPAEQRTATNIALAVGAFSELTDPEQRVQAALMLGKAFEYCHVTARKQCNELFDIEESVKRENSAASS